MAITIKYNPPAYSSVHDDLIYTVAEPVKTADPATYPNYKFIADVYVNGNMVARLKRVQDPLTGIGVFNIGQVIRSYINATFNPTGSAIVAQAMATGDFNVSVQIKFGEEYAYTSYYNLTLDSSRVFFNNYNTRPFGTTSSLTAYAGKVASRRTGSGKVLGSSSFYFIPYFANTNSPISVTVTPNIGTTYTTSVTPAAANTMLVFNVAPININALLAGVITPATTYYTVQIGAQSYRIDVICEPTYTPYAVHFLNQYGGFETKLFSKVSQTSYDIERKDYGKQAFTVDANGIPSYKSATNVYNETKPVYSVQMTEKMTLNSDWVTDGEYLWLADLFFSPQVYLEQNGYFYPVSLSAKDYTPKQFAVDELTNITMEVVFGNQLNAQFR